MPNSLNRKNGIRKLVEISLRPVCERKIFQFKSLCTQPAVWIGSFQVVTIQKCFTVKRPLSEIRAILLEEFEDFYREYLCKPYILWGIFMLELFLQLNPKSFFQYLLGLKLARYPHPYFLQARHFLLGKGHLP